MLPSGKSITVEQNGPSDDANKFFKDVVALVSQTLVVLDPEGLALKRGWVLYEAWATLMAHPNLPRCVCLLSWGVQWSPLLQV